MIIYTGSNWFEKRLYSSRGTVKLIKVYEFVPHLLWKPVKPQGMDKHKLLFYSLNVRVFHFVSGKVTPKPANAKEKDKNRVQSAKGEILSSGSRGKNF